MNKGCDIFLLAGETSGDLHGSALLKSLYEKNPSLVIAGVGGKKMRACKFDCVMPTEKFQVMGFVDVFLALPRLIKQFYAVRRSILALNPTILVTIDYPGFNLRMIRSLRRKGFKGKICHYICPSVWAWGKERIPFLENHVDLLLTIFPFEKKYFNSSLLDVTYVGNPLLEQIKEARKREKSFQIALFPGSRTKEIVRNLPLFLRVCERLYQENPQLSFALALAGTELQQTIQPLLSTCKLPIQLVDAAHHKSLIDSSYLALAKSGTITLELALYGLPTVVTYKISCLDTWIAKYIFKINLPFYCLANIVAEKEVFPEFIGPGCDEERVYMAAKNFLADSEKYSLCLQGCLQLRKQLHGGEKASAKILALL